MERRRVIRESTRKATSTSYKVNLESRKNDEDVHVVITHESIPSFKKEYLFKANQLQGKKSIHFRWDRKKVEWESNLEFGSDTTSNAFIPAYQKTENKPVVTVFADDNKKYLSTDLAKDIEDNEEYISNSIELINYEVI